MVLCHHRMSSSETFCVLSLFSFMFLYNATTDRKTSSPKVKQDSFCGRGSGVFVVAAWGRVDPLRTLAMGAVGGQASRFSVVF